MITVLKDIILHSPAQLITYADYINAALYHPKLGYYMNDKQKIGREGDFITTSNVSDIFGRTCAKWFAHVVQKTLLPHVFCEVGAGNGRRTILFRRGLPAELGRTSCSRWSAYRRERWWLCPGAAQARAVRGDCRQEHLGF